VPLSDGEAIVIVDLDHEEDRRQLIRSIRREGFAGPALVVGGTEPPESPEDEMLPRPVRLGMLLARLDAHWTRDGDAHRLILGPYELAPDDRDLRHSETGARIRLTELERKLLCFLADAAGETVSRDQLLAGVWGYGPGTETHTVETHIWRLRQKVETDDEATRFLIGEAGGYRLAGYRPQPHEVTPLAETPRNG
jgi:hypothetical protein